MMSQNESRKDIIVRHRAYEDENLDSYRSSTGGFRILDLYTASYALVARSSFNHPPPFRYMFIKNRAGGDAASMRSYIRSCMSFAILERIIPDIDFLSSDVGTNVDLAFNNRRDLALFRVMFPDTATLRR
jgi:hypothetical protein